MLSITFLVGRGKEEEKEEEEGVNLGEGRGGRVVINIHEGGRYLISNLIISGRMI